MNTLERSFSGTPTRRPPGPDVRRWTLTALLWAVAACGADSGSEPTALEPGTGEAVWSSSRAWSGWSEAEPVTGVNTAANEARPALSRDGLSLYFHSDREGGLGRNDIWVARRACLGCDWEEPVNLGAPVNTAAFNEAGPALSRDGHWLFFNTNRSPGGQGGGDIWASYRDDLKDDLAWGPPVNLGPGVNGPGGDTQPSFFENEDGRPQLFFTRAPGHIWASELQPDGTWGPAVLQADLSVAGNALGPSIHPNGRELYFWSGRSGISRIWYAVREDTGLHASWSEPVLLGAFTPGEASVFQPAIHALGRTETLLMTGFTAAGGQEIYQATRMRGAR